MQDASNQEVLVYCPKCSVQNPLDKSLLGTSVICIKCGHPFIAKRPKTESSSKKGWIMALLVIGVVIFVSIMNMKWMGTEVINNAPQKEMPQKEMLQKDNALIKKYIDECGIRFREYGQKQSNSGVLDIYFSQTGEELMGVKAPKKYRQAIEQALEEAKSLHSWCEEKQKTFKPQMLTKEGEAQKNMARELYTSCCELTSISIRLFSKTLECHQIFCGMRSDASPKDKEAYIAFSRKNPNVEESLNKKADEVMQIAAKLASVEEERFARMEQAYSNLVNQVKTSSQ